MKIETRVATEADGRLLLHAWTAVRPDGAPDADPTWIMARLDPRTGVLNGIHAGRSAGVAPRVVPFLFEFPFAEPDRAVAALAPIAPVLLGTLASLEMRRPGAGAASDLPLDQVEAWRSFRASGAIDLGRAAQREAVEIDGDLGAAADIVVTRKAGEVGLRDPRRLRAGSPLSGFQALAAAADPRLPFRPALPAAIDRERARAALAAVDRPSSHAVSWFGQATGETAEARLQAARSFPVLAGLIAETPSLARIVDARDPLQPALTERTGLGKGALKRLAALRAPFQSPPLFARHAQVQGADALGVDRDRRFGAEGAATLDRALKILAALPPDRTPADDESWGIFQDLLAGCVLPLSNALDWSPEEILGACSGDWREFRDALARAADVPPAEFDRRRIALTTVDAIEAVDALAREVLLPRALASVIETGEPVPGLSPDILSSALRTAGALARGKARNPAGQLFETARRWIGRIGATQRIIGRVPVTPQAKAPDRRWGDAGFPPLTERFTASNGVVAIPLNTEAEIKAEGAAMRHCVGTYVGKARRMACHLVSLRDGDRRLSTLELSGLEGPTPLAAAVALRVYQNRAQGNGNPPPRATQAVEELLQALRQGRAPLFFEEIAAWRAEAERAAAAQRKPAPEIGWVGALELDWRRPEVVSGLWEEWRGILGGPMGRAESSAVVYRDPGARALVSRLSPRAAEILAERAATPPVRLAGPAPEETPAP